MARQSGLLRFKGRIGDLSFYVRQGVPLVRSAEGIPRERFLRDPAFDRARRNCSEFGSVTQTAALLRRAFLQVCPQGCDSQLFHRLASTLHRIKLMDRDNPHGQRNILGGLSHPEGRKLLSNFPLNSQTSLEYLLAAKPRVEEESRKVIIPALDPSLMRLHPGATHFELVASWLQVDLEEREYNITQSATASIPLNGEAQEIHLSPSKWFQGPGLQLVVCSLRCLVEQGDNYQPLYDMDYHAGAIMWVG